MKSIEKTAKDFLFIGFVSCTLWFYLEGFVREFYSGNDREVIKPERIGIREEGVSERAEKIPEQKKTGVEILPEKTEATPNREAERILNLIREGKLSSYKASFYRKWPSEKQD